MFGFVAVALLDFVLGFFGADFGFNGFGAMGLLSSFIGLGLGVLMLILDFDFVERGIAAGLPGARVLARGLRPDRHDHLDLHRAAADPRDPARQRLTARGPDATKRPWLWPGALSPTCRAPHP